MTVQGPLGPRWAEWLVRMAGAFFLRDEDDVPVRRTAASVSSNFFDVLGTGPEVGRLFGPEDEPLGHPPVVVLSHALWQTLYGGDRP